MTRVRSPEETIAAVVGRSPFDFINSDFRMSLVMALYDAMGKHLGVPVYKLMGQKVRDAVPTAAWTRPCPPDVFREEVRRAAASGVPRLQDAQQARSMT